MKTSEITLGGIIIAFTMVSYMMFKGTTNLMNAIVVPLLLYYCISKQSKKAAITTVFAFLILTSMLFKQQIIFSIFYVILAYSLSILTVNKTNFPLKATVLSLMATISFIIAIRLTDYLLMTKIEAFMLYLAQDNYFIYFGIMLLQGTIAGVGLAYSAKLIDKKLSI